MNEMARSILSGIIGLAIGTVLLIGYYWWTDRR